MNAAAVAEGEFFQSDLVGCRLWMRRAANRWVWWKTVQQYGGPPLLVVRYEGREVLIPFVPAICDVDMTAKVIRATLPDGLLEL